MEYLQTMHELKTLENHLAMFNIIRKYMFSRKSLCMPIMPRAENWKQLRNQN